MDGMNPNDHQASDPHAGHTMSDMHGSHDRHAGHSVAMFREKCWLSLILTIPVVFWSSDVQHWLGYTAPSFPGSKFIPAILGTVVFVYGSLVFIQGAWSELADHKPGMMTLISLAIIVAFGTSLAATFGLFEIDVWWEVASSITIMVLGHWLEMRAISQARGALNALAALLPDTAERVTGSQSLGTQKPRTLHGRCLSSPVMAARHLASQSASAPGIPSATSRPLWTTRAGRSCPGLRKAKARMARCSSSPSYWHSCRWCCNASCPGFEVEHRLSAAPACR